MPDEHKIKRDVIVLGGGAAGCMAAITAARSGAQVLILEQNDRIGRKILATGNGKCNFTNENMTVEAFHGNRRMVLSALEAFGLSDTLDFFHGIGIYPKCKNGYYYPNSQTASSIRNALEAELARCGAEIKTGIVITEIIAKSGGDSFQIAASDAVFECRKLILAAGLLASPKSGSNGSAFAMIESLGHHFTDIVPALCGFYAKGLDFKKAAGVRTEANVSLYLNGRIMRIDESVVSSAGELQLTDYGISGIPVFQISRYASFALKEGKKTEASLDFLPFLTAPELKDELRWRWNRFDHPAACLNGLFNEKLSLALLKLAGISPSAASADIPCHKIEKLSVICKDCRVTLTSAREFEYAQVCAGGIVSEEVDECTLESKLLPGLYFAGELLDVDGICGGYNLQWAWSSGYVAGNEAAHSLKP